jgi:hypothetical protein
MRHRPSEWKRIQQQNLELPLDTPDLKRPTAAEIDAARTPDGGWTRDQLAEWGVPWPPPKGWRKRLIEAHRPKDTLP